MPIRAAVAVAAVLSATPALAATRLAIAPIRDDAGGAVAAQLDAALCGTWSCLPGALAGPKLDLARARKLGAAGALVASVWAEKGGKVLSVALFTTGATAARTWKLPLGADGRLGKASLDRLLSELKVALPPGAAARPPPPAPAPVAVPRPTPPAPAAAPAPPAAAPARPPPPAPTPTVVSTTPPGWQPPRPVGPQGAAPGRPVPRVAVEVGLFPNHRELRYEQVAPVPVGVKSDQPAMPRLRLEVQPVATLGAILYGDFAFGSGVELTAGARTHQATATRLEAGLAWRLPLSRAFTVVPLLALQRETFTVGAAGGVSLAGFADQQLLGVRAGGRLELWLEKTRFTLLAGAAGTWWLQKGELVGGAGFFPGGSAWGLSAEAGLQVDLWGPLSVRALGDLAMTRWSLDATPTWGSRWARQEIVGGRIMVRAGF